MRRLFEHYCSYGDVKNKTTLKSSNFVKFLKEANIICSSKSDRILQLSTTDADILYKQFAGKQHMTFEVFVPCLAHIATVSLAIEQDKQLSILMEALIQECLAVLDQKLITQAPYAQ